MPDHEPDGFSSGTLHPPEPDTREQITAPAPKAEAARAEPIAERPAPSQNYYTTGTVPYITGPKGKYAANISAIRLLQALEQEVRPATPEEQAVLARYSGWGGIPQAFDESNAKWTAEYQELKNLLSDSEYASARASTLNAHYTAFPVIDAVYSALTRFGFTGGRLLEPALGVGYFFSRLPEALRGCKLAGAELDSISGSIAKLLYPKADIRIQGYETTNFKDNSFDAAVGNVPFGNYRIHDPRYPTDHLIHDYFFLRTMDQVRPHGIVAFITSIGTLDKADSTVRRLLVEQAELVGAIRLPDNAFKAVAGTEVSTDILFLQKREHPTVTEPDWIHIGRNEQGIPINEYYLTHPEMILGEMAFDRSMYGDVNDTACHAIPDRDLKELLAEAVSKLPESVMRPYEPAPEPAEQTLPADPRIRNFTYGLVDGAVYYRVNGEMTLQQLSAKETARITGWDRIRTSLLETLDAQRLDFPDREITEAQNRLNEAYDAFTAQFGNLSDRANTRALREDNDLSLLTALEWQAEDGAIRKADVFTSRTIRSAKLAETANSAQDALMLSLNACRSVDFAYMRKVYGKPEDEIASELGGLVYLNPDRYDPAFPYRGWEMADEYLSGNVRDKLAQARISAAQYPDRFSRNVDALEQVQPKPLEATEISVQLGTPWLEPEYIDQFLYELLDTPRYLRGNTPNDLHTVYDRYNGRWTILNQYQDSTNVTASKSYGTSRIDAYELIEQSLNLQTVTIKDSKSDGKGGTVWKVNTKQTMIARGKQESIKAKFSSWIFQDAGRREKLVAYYNDHFNNVVPRSYDGSHLLLPGLNPRIKLRPHQLNAVARAISGDGSSLLAHVVGAGKTFTMIVAAHEELRLGMARKAAFVVPNHLTEQFGADIHLLYPDAKVLISTKTDFEKQNRQRFLSRIAMSDVEYVVIGHSQFERIPMSDEYRAQELERQLSELVLAIDETKRQRGEKYSVKQLEGQRASLKTELQKLNTESRKDSQILFEQLGIGSLFVDEAHYYKNLATFSKMRNVAGVSNAHSQKASDMLMKVNYMREHHGLIHFATGTPLSNSMAELYVLQVYLQPDALEARGIHHFDEWAAQFGKVVTESELTPEGNGLRPRTRFSKFQNLPELMSIFRQVADIQTAEMLNLPIPKLAGGKPTVVKSRPSANLELYMADGIKRVERIHNGSVSPFEDNMLKFTSDAKKAGLDMRLIDPDADCDPDGKIAECARRAYHHYAQTQKERGVQLVFCDTSTPKKDGFDVYTEFKRQAVELGIPAAEIAFIHDASTDLKRDELFAKCRSGEVRVLLGSTQKCGAGTNIQDRLIALHHLDCPFRPSDIEQREGRILRQGNLCFDEVHVYRYVTEKSFDAYLWSIVENKAKFISQIMTAKKISRTCEDMDEAVLSYSEVKAIASGDPRIKEKMDTDMEVTRLRMLQNEYEGQRYQLERDLRHTYPAALVRAQEAEANIRADIALAEQNVLPEFRMVLGGHLFKERPEAGQQLLLLAKKVNRGEPVLAGQYRGFTLELSKGFYEDDFRAEIKGNSAYMVELSSDPVGAVTRIENAVKKLPEKLEEARQYIESIQQSIKKSELAFSRPFDYEDDLHRMLEKQAALDFALTTDEKTETDGENPEKGEQEMTVVLVEPGKPARMERFRGELKEMEQLVGGPLETARPFDDSAVLVCNRNGKTQGMPPNRKLNGDVVAGTFLICGDSGGDFTSLDRRQMTRYLGQFGIPDRFDLSAVTPQRGGIHAEPIGR